MISAAPTAVLSSEGPPLRIRELGLGGVLDDAVVIIRHRFALFLAIVLIVFAPLTAVAVVATARVQQDMLGNNPAAFQRAFEDYVFVLIPLLLLQTLVVIPLTVGALTHAAASGYLGRDTTLRECLRRTLRRSIPLMTAYLLFLVCVGVGSLLCLVPGVLFYLWFLLALQAVIIEGRGPIAALNRSMELTKSNLVSVLGLAIVLVAVRVGLGGVAAFIPQVYVQAVANALAQGVVLAFETTVCVVLYFSMCCRRENYDLELLAAAVAAGDEEHSPETAFSSAAPPGSGAL
jgi:hypothetical protein